MDTVLNRFAYSIPLVVAGLFIQPCNALNISWNFGQGSLGGWEEENGEVKLRLAGGKDGVWYYFRADGVQNETVSFVIEDARADVFGEYCFPFISYDQEEWLTVKERTVRPLDGGEDRVEFRFAHTFGSERAWIAFAPPFTNSMLDRLAAETRGHPHCEAAAVCETAQAGLPLTLFRITDPETRAENKAHVAILAREAPMETAGSWVCKGLIEFLLSDRPSAAALKRRAVFSILPVVDPDGVARGAALHPYAGGRTMDWTAAWDETGHSFFEQRAIKAFFQENRGQVRPPDIVLRLGSSHWGEDRIVPEHAAESRFADQDALYNAIMREKYMPWFAAPGRESPAGVFTAFAAALNPGTLAARVQSDWIFHEKFGTPYHLTKTPSDIELEGELIALALAEHFGSAAADPPPFLHAAELFRMSEPGQSSFHVRCVYRDLLNRPPEYVRVVVDGRPFDLRPAEPGTADAFQGILYTGFVTAEKPDNQHFFVTSNGTRARRAPVSGSRPGPFSVPRRPG